MEDTTLKPSDTAAKCPNASTKPILATMPRPLSDTRNIRSEVDQKLSSSTMDKPKPLLTKITTTKSSTTTTNNDTNNNKGKQRQPTMLDYLYQANPTNPPPGVSISPSTSSSSTNTPKATTSSTLRTLAKTDSRSSRVRNGDKRKASSLQPSSDPQYMLKRHHSGHAAIKAVDHSWLNSPRPVKKTLQRMGSFDRFIPHRPSMDIQSSQFNLTNTKEATDLDHDTLGFNERVAKALGYSRGKRILSFVPAAPEYNKTEDPRHKLLPLYTAGGRRGVSSLGDDGGDEEGASKRHIVTAPEKILDAPSMKDDYYLNLLDWSCQNVVAIGLDQSVYLWNADNGSIQNLNYKGDDPVTSLSWTDDGSYLAIGIESGDTQIWDVESNTKLRSMTGRRCRVGVLSWQKHLLSSGAKDGSIWHHDVRVKQHKTAELLKHEDEVCGLEWSPDGIGLASGGNDHLVCVWDSRSSSTGPKFCKDIHLGAIKALAWCPWNHHVLATGGGREDKKIHFWNTKTTARVQSVQTSAQVTSLRWSRHYREIVSTHGFPNNQISVWSYPKLQKIVDIPGHDSRILHSALSPDGQVLATTAADENLKFWRIFDNDGSHGPILPKAQSERTAFIRKTTSLR